MTIHIIIVWVFVMHIFVRMTIHILIGFCRVHVCTNYYPFPCVWVFVMHISVRMTTISFCMGFRYAHLCKNDYHLFLNGFSSCTFLYKWLPFLFEWVFVMHISVRRNTIFFLNGFSSCTFLFEWLPFLFEWVFVMYISVRMTTISLRFFPCVQCSSTRE